VSGRDGEGAPAGGPAAQSEPDRGGRGGRRQAQRSDARAVLALGGPILFTPPALALADREAAILGVPSLALYVFIAWLAGIVLTFLAARLRRGSG